MHMILRLNCTIFNAPFFLSMICLGSIPRLCLAICLFSISGAVYGKEQGRAEHIPLSFHDLWIFLFSFSSSIPPPVDVSLFSLFLSR